MSVLGRTSIFCLLLTGLVFGSSEFKILEREVLSAKSFILNPGEQCEYQAKTMKLSGNLDPKVRIGLRVRAIIQSTDYNGWNRLMQIKVGSHLVERNNSALQPRLLNRSDIKKPEGTTYQNYYGESWYFTYAKSWDICYGKEFVEPPTRFDPAFAEDVTDYLFDIDDLVTVDAPIQIQISNIGNTLSDIMGLVNHHNKKFPMAVGAVEVLKFENPADRAAVFVELTPPGEQQIKELRKRLNIYPEFSETGYREELKNLRYSETAFADCERTWQLPFTIPGHLWLSYGYYHSPDQYVELLDWAKEAGVGLVKVHAHWASIDGKGPFTIPDETGKKNLRGLAKLCHDRGMKFIAYISPAWVKRNESYNPEWEFPDPTSRAKSNTEWGRVCTGSPSWRSFFFKGVQSIFDNFPEVDGLYADYGIVEEMERSCTNPLHVNAFKNSKNPLAASEDIYNRLYALCKKNNKLLYVFAESIPNTQGYCDVHYVGESTQTMPAHRQRHGDFKGNIFFLQMMAYTYYSQREVYGTTMSLGHFPLMTAYSQRDPKGEALWFGYFLGVWREMSRPGTHIYRDIRNSPLFKSIPKDVMVTAFVNSSAYLVVYNGGKAETVRFSQPLENLETGKSDASFQIPERDLLLLRINQPVQ